jgi:ubiquinol-cytochrome c reductase cytochrome c subunit
MWGYALLGANTRAAVGFIVSITVSALLILGCPHAAGQTATLASKPGVSANGNAKNGKRVYISYGCYECHGREGQGSVLSGPRIGPDPIQLSPFVRYIREPKGQMPPYTEKVVSDAELADVYAFLQSLPQPPDPKSIPLLNSEPGSEKRK